AEVIYDLIQRKKGNPGLYRLNDAFTNISCGIVDQLSGVFAKVFTVWVYAMVFDFFTNQHSLEWKPSWYMYVLAFVLIDLAYYWSHRLSHQVNLFWVGHVVHHQSEEYNLSVALRQGAFQKVLMFWIYLPLAMFGLPPGWFAVSMGFNLLYQFWIHTEHVKTMGIFEHVLNTPSHHRVHHGRNPKYIDKNHAGVFIIWDRLFGTFQKEEERPVYGITRPTNTFNPVLAHVQPFQRLIKDVGSIPNWTDKFKFLFNSPGWYPQSMGGVQSAPEVPKEYQKFHLVLPLQLNVYLLVQYFILVATTAFFLFTYLNYHIGVQVGVVVWVLLSLLAIGGIFDRSKIGRSVELFRLVFSAFFVAILVQVFGFPMPFFVVSGLNLLSIFWFLRVYKQVS
ncbi:MAG: sterol desaturase family protein, partial [Flavobacteriales bacterium]